MASIGALSIDLIAQTASFVADLGKATRALDSNTAQMNRALKSLQTGFAGLQTMVGRFTGALGVGLGVSFLKSSLDAAGGIGELAEQLGLSTDALQGYQYAASQAGVKQGELESGIARLTKTVGEAADGNKEAVKSFEGLGIGVLNANGQVRSTEDILRDVANALLKIEDPATRARVAVELMGRGGQRLLPILSQGAAGLDEFIATAKRLGLVLDEDTIKKSDAASDKIAEMERQWSNLAATLTSKIAPFLTDAANGFQRLLGNMSDSATFAEKLLQVTQEIAQLEAQQNSTTVAGKARAASNADRLEELRRERDALLATGPNKSIFTAAGDTHNPPVKDDKAESAKKRLDEYILSLQAEQSQIGMNNREREIAQKLYQAEAIARAGNIKLTDDQRAQIEQITGAIIDNTDAEKQQDEALQSALDGLKVYADTQAEISDNAALIQALQQGSREYEKQAAYLQIINKYKQAGIEIDAQVIQNAREQADALGDQRDQIDKLKDANKGWKDAGRDATQAIGTAFEDAVLKGEKLRDVFAGLLEDIARIIMRVIVTKPLENALTGVINGMGSAGGAGSSGFFDGVLSWIGGMFSGGGGAAAGASAGGGMVGLYADGGRPPVGKPSIVGEEGAEWFVPDVAGTIIPRKDLAGGKGGDTFVIDARGADREGMSRLEKMIKSINGSIEKRAISAVVNERRRTPGLFPA